MAGAYHETWVIIGENGTVCHYSDDDSFCVYLNEPAAIKECAKLMKKYPNKVFRIKKTKLPIPWV